MSERLNLNGVGLDVGVFGICLSTGNRGSIFQGSNFLM